jgi:endogenous inhibitor of DNA gyrase (YacG/DUF329 family)
MPTKVRCPTCDIEVVWNDEARFRPFCSNRCKQIDLGAWASDSYSIPGAPEQDEANREDGADRS